MHVHCKLGLNSPRVCKASWRTVFSWGIILSQGSWILTFQRYFWMYLPHVAVSCHRRMESTTKLMRKPQTRKSAVFYFITIL